MLRPAAFLLSPARCGGRRAQTLLRAEADFELARRLRAPEGIPLGEAFAFMSGLYFRGKLAYARAFADGGRGALVIAPGRGLLAADTPVRRDDLLAMSEVPVSHEEPAFRAPLERDALRLAAARPGEPVVLLGSIATDKYADVLLACFAERLLFPLEFVGRGDMSRGGLMLRCARDARELTYVPLAGAVRRGPRPPRLEREPALRVQPARPLRR